MAELTDTDIAVVARWQDVGQLPAVAECEGKTAAHHGAPRQAPVDELLDPLGVADQDGDASAARCQMPDAEERRGRGEALRASQAAAEPVEIRRRRLRPGDEVQRAGQVRRIGRGRERHRPSRRGCLTRTTRMRPQRNRTDDSNSARQ